jgi:hypothetical protein
VPNASNVNFRRGQDVAGLSFAGLGANGKVNLLSVSSTNVIADVAGYFTGVPIADQGVHPMACEDMMQITRVDGATHSIVVRDRTGVHADITIATGLPTRSGGQIMGTCDFVAIYAGNADGTTRVERYSFGGRRMGVIAPSITFSARTWSPDGKYLFTTEDFSTTGTMAYAARTIYRTNVYTGERVLLHDAKANVMWDIENFGSTGSVLYLSATSATSGYGQYFVNTATGEVTMLPSTNLNVYKQAVSPDGSLFVFANRVDANNSTIAVCLGNGSCAQFSGVWADFTAQNELVVFHKNTLPTVYHVVSANGAISVDGGTDIPLSANEFAPWFATYALV